MNSITEVLSILESKQRGTFRSFAMIRECQVKKGEPTVYKVTMGTVRAGIDYSRLKDFAPIAKARLQEIGIEYESATKEQIASVVEPLKNGVWRKWPYWIECKGKPQIRLYWVLDEMGKPACKSHYILHGESFTKKEIAEKVKLYASELSPRKTSPGGVFQVKLENITQLV